MKFYSQLLTLLTRNLLLKSMFAVKSAIGPALKLVVFLVAALIGLSGCASFDFGLGEAEQPEEAQVAQEPKPKSDTVGDESAPSNVSTDQTGTEITEPKLTPEQMRIAELKAKPNLYFAGSPIPPEPATSLFQQGIAAKKQQDFEKAKSVFVQLTRDYPQLSGPYVQLGDLVLQQHELTGNTEEQAFQKTLTDAENFYQAAINANQHNYFAHNRLAKVYREKGQFDLAERHYKQAINSWPAFDKAYLNLGILYDLYLGKKALAMRQYETYQGLQLNPGRKINGWIADLKRQIARANQ